MDWQRKLKEAQVSAAALRQSVSGMNSEKKQPLSSSKWRAFFRRSPLEDVVVVKNNVYNKGFLHNIQEVISPLSTRQSFKQTKLKSS
jgi:palmitoyltransferase